MHYVILLIAFFPAFLLLYAYMMHLLEKKPFHLTYAYITPVLYAYVIYLIILFVWRLVHAVYA
jgi:hypothetical protein